MRNFVAAFALGAFCFANVANAQDTELRPLADVLEDESSDSTVLYALERCGALYYATYIYSNNSPNKDAELLDRLRGLSSQFIFLAGKMIASIREIDDEAAQKIALNVVNDLVDIYIAKMDAQYLKSGEAFDDGVKSDLEVCGKIAETLQ